MPYCEPHRTVRARIIDLEIMKLELRRGARARAQAQTGEIRPIARPATSPRRGA
jgi:hypothetical protein